MLLFLLFSLLVTRFQNKSDQNFVTWQFSSIWDSNKNHRNLYVLYYCRLALGFLTTPYCNVNFKGNNMDFLKNKIKKSISAVMSFIFFTRKLILQKDPTFTIEFEFAQTRNGHNSKSSLPKCLQFHRPICFSIPPPLHRRCWRGGIAAAREAFDSPRKPEAAPPQGLSPRSKAHISGGNGVEEVMGALGEMGITEPTEIQCIGIPAVLDGKSVVLGSHTGSGKTLAYLLPLVQV